MFRLCGCTCICAYYYVVCNVCVCVHVKFQRHFLFLTHKQRLHAQTLIMTILSTHKKHIANVQHDARNNLEVANRGMERARKELIDAENLVMAARTVSQSLTIPVFSIMNYFRP
jgi:hypothetical protein